MVHLRLPSAGTTTIANAVLSVSNADTQEEGHRPASHVQIGTPSERTLDGGERVLEQRDGKGGRGDCEAQHGEEAPVAAEPAPSGSACCDERRPGPDVLRAHEDGHGRGREQESEAVQERR